MCRAGERHCHENGHSRRARQRAAYQARKAAAATSSPPSPPPVPQLDPLSPTVLRAERDRVAALLDDPQVSIGTKEAAVTALGARLAASAHQHFDMDSWAEQINAHAEQTRIEAEALRQSHNGYAARELEAGVEMATKEGFARARDAYVQALQAVRPLGGQLSNLAPNTHKGSLQLVQDAATRIPTDWIDSSNAHQREVRIRSTDGRAHYSPAAAQKERVLVNQSRLMPADWTPPADDPRWEGWTASDETTEGWLTASDRPTRGLVRTWTGPGFNTRTIRAGSSVKPKKGWVLVRQDEYESVYKEPLMRTGVARFSAEITVPSAKNPLPYRESTAAHELSHRCEHVVPRIAHLEAEFIRRRTTNDEGVQDRLEHLGRGYGRDEVTRPDGFANRYIGKAYPNGHYYEVLSMGIESVYHGANGGFLGVSRYRPDLDARNFILGLLAVA